MQKVDNLVFRDLRADEIEVRVGRLIGNDNAELLLYKTARVDRDILNETVGKTGWAQALDVKPLPDTGWDFIALWHNVFWHIMDTI